MKTAIVQIYVSLNHYSSPGIIPSFDELSQTSFSLVKRYAKKYNADYHLLTDPYINYLHPTYERFRLFEEAHWTENYDQILYLDSDVFVYDDSPNIFEIYTSSSTFKVCTHWNTYKYGVKNLGFNAGVFMLNKSSRDKMLPFLNYKLETPPKSHDNDILIDCMEKSNVEVEYMDARFNAKNEGNGTFFCHVWGSGKRKKPDMPCILKAIKEARELC